MNVLLICPPATLGLPDLGRNYTFLQFFLSNLFKPNSRTTVVGEHLGLGYLTASLERAGHHVTLLDACLLQYTNWQQVAADLHCMTTSFGLVGFTGSQDVFLENVSIASALRKWGWQSHFIAGQDFCSLNHEEILRKFPMFDSIGRGEGDELIVDLANTLEQGGDLGQVAGLTHRTASGLQVNPSRPLIPELDCLPFPDRRNWSHSQRAGLALGMVSSRGCGYNRCTFCYPSVFTAANQMQPGGPWRARSAENVVEELARISREYDPQRITFVDENFLGCSQLAIERAYQIGHEILRRKLDVKYMINIRSVDVNHDLLKLLQESGLCSLFIGFESGSQKILDYYQKGATVKQQAESLRTIQELGIDLVVGYIFFDPLSTIDDLRQSLAFYMTLNQYDASKFSQRLRVLPGTAIYRRMQAEKTVFGDIWRTTYDFSSTSIDTVYTLVRGLFHVLLPTLLERSANQRFLSDRQSERAIAMMERDFTEAMTAAENGLEHNDPAIQEMITRWSGEILQCIHEG
jgi:anaerobic magnesium-protoporphyrin IX monomethyl ester cyclase